MNVLHIIAAEALVVDIKSAVTQAPPFMLQYKLWWRIP